MAIRKLTFRVAIWIDDEASAAEVNGYIQEAVRCWGKGGHPDDVFFQIEEKDVSVLTWKTRAGDASPYEAEAL